MDPAQIAVAFLCLAVGGILKGATGAGAPVLVVPALTMMFDVRFAVVVMLMPNLITNLWQTWRFRHKRLPTGFNVRFAGSGAIGVIIGTLILANLSPEVLSLVVAFAVFAYIGFRFARPDWVIPFARARTLSIPAGLVAGMLQGASGLSAPVSLSFLNAMRLERPYFISTASIFFVSITVLQIPTLDTLGLLTWDRLLVSFAALVPILAFMPVGARIARRFSKDVFDRVILVLLACLAVKLVFDAVL